MKFIRNALTAMTGAFVSFSVWADGAATSTGIDTSGVVSAIDGAKTSGLTVGQAVIIAAAAFVVINIVLSLIKKL
ncbi:major capsid protein [Zooshikella ganghwensis]|uniref:major capsid protein n=1 Tax=Zooshikella ganghwensis TaxID=202772 RepID=UPI00041C2989|nr:major capsid protein [Zooshikella ganghwensis]